MWRWAKRCSKKAVSTSLLLTIWLMPIKKLSNRFEANNGNSDQQRYAGDLSGFYWCPGELPLGAMSLLWNEDGWGNHTWKRWHDSYWTSCFQYCERSQEADRLQCFDDLCSTAFCGRLDC